MAICPYNTASEDYADFIYRYSSQEGLIPGGSSQPGICFEFASEDFGIVYAPLQYILPLSLEKYAYYSIPKLYTLLDSDALEASGILPAFNAPALNNRGRGTIIGLIDTGIDYTNPLFLRPGGGSRILSIWDQTLPEGSDSIPPGVPGLDDRERISYGTEFTQEQLDAALESENPRLLVPTDDTNGHGTFLAGVAAGNSLPNQEFSGAAPEADLMVVKLKPAKEYLRDFFLIPDGVPSYQENDIMMAIKYLRIAAHNRRQPLIILLGLGTNSGNHEGLSPLSQTLRGVTGLLEFAAVVAAGNETGLSHHYLGNLSAPDSYEDVEIRVGEAEAQRGFILELWASDNDVYSAGFISPSGERVDRIPIIPGNETQIPFFLDQSTIVVNYVPIEASSGRHLVFLRFLNPVQGIWRVRVYSTLYFTGDYHMWLPAEGFISPETIFLRPNPYTTITSPGDTPSVLTIAACSHRDNSIYIHSSRGFTPSGQIKPDLAAPGVDILGPGPSRENDVSLVRRSGTSIAAAQTAGAVANLIGWGLGSRYFNDISQAAIRSYLIRGANRNPALTYPNREWGYGELDLYESFLRLRDF